MGIKLASELKLEFRKEFFAKVEADGNKINGQAFVEMETCLYIEWLEAKVNNFIEDSKAQKEA